MIERVFASDFLDATVQVDTPEPLVPVQAPRVFVAPVFVAENVGVTETIALVWASLRVIVISEVDELLATTVPVPEPVIVESTEDAAPGMNVTAVLSELKNAGSTNDMVLASAVVDFSVKVAIPLALVFPLTVATVLPEPVAPTVTVTPTLGLEYWSSMVIVMFERPELSATTVLLPDAVIVVVERL